jgi:hypothetical protein
VGDEFFFPTPNGASSAPQVEDGLALWRFDDIRLVEHEDWAVDRDAYGNKDDGRRYHFVGTLMEDKTTPVYGEDGDPVELEKLTRTATGKRSGFRAVMEGLLTPAEFERFLNSTAEAPFNGAAIRGRVYNIKVGHSKSDWPHVEDIIGQAK